MCTSHRSLRSPASSHFSNALASFCCLELRRGPALPCLATFAVTWLELLVDPSSPSAFAAAFARTLSVPSTHSSTLTKSNPRSVSISRNETLRGPEPCARSITHAQSECGRYSPAPSPMRTAEPATARSSPSMALSHPISADPTKTALKPARWLRASEAKARRRTGAETEIASGMSRPLKGEPGTGVGSEQAAEEQDSTDTVS
mmetsp:Transcript_28751/g.68166  ORF Transcript_28751/g.68166 Transcript_28751/m.68166 type:complete len:203 (+) Transcript_28751:106-714(+)